MLPKESQNVKNWLKDRGFDAQIKFMEKSAKTAPDAADALGCDLGQIAKSLVFYEVVTKKPVLVIASGQNRVDKEKVGNLLSAKIKTAGPDYVLEVTGFCVGGVPPIGHKQNIKTVMDQDLLQYDLVWAAAGHPHTLFPIPPKDLLLLSQAELTVLS